MAASPKPSGAEQIKSESQGLRGHIGAELAAEASQGGVSEETYTLLKFHGTYEQYDRDSATPRKQAGLDKEWGFMVRVRCPAGRLSTAQWLALDALADRHGDATLRLTTRQGIQFHGVARGAVKPLIAGINQALMTTLAACGDVVRNVVTSPAPRRDALHARLEAEAVRLSSALLPRSRAHHQIFLDEAPEQNEGPEEEPLYGPTYLPRKFKIALAHPGDNTPDLLTNDLGFLALVEEGQLAGWIVTLGGGMGMTHNKPATYPRLADPIARIGPDEVLELAQAAVRLARDHGDRSDRKHARLKYLVAKRGVDWVRQWLAADLGHPLAEPGPLPALAVPELLGWHPQGDGRWWIGLPIPAGRIGGALRRSLRDAIARFGADPVVTPQQDLLLTNIAATDRAALEAMLREAGLALAGDLTPLARWTLACVALPSCGQALAEGERVRQRIVDDLEQVLARHGLREERLSLRITGCPNGCARPYGGEIGVVGRAPGLYVLYLGGDFEGTRLSFPVADKVRLEAIAATLEPALAAWAAQRQGAEDFGAFCERHGQAALQALLGATLVG